MNILFKHRVKQEVPLDSTAHNGMQPCPRCRTLMIGRLPVCPNCNEPLLHGTLQIGAQFSTPEEFSLGRALVAATLLSVAPSALVVGVVYIMAGTPNTSKGQDADIAMLGIAAACFFLTTSCIAGVVLLFKKRY